MRTLTFTFEMVSRGDIIKNTAPAMTLPITVPNYGSDPRSRQRAHREAVLSERIQHAMDAGMSISAVIRPDCDCATPREGASRTCAHCGGSNWEANPRASEPSCPAPTVVPPVPLPGPSEARSSNAPDAPDAPFSLREARRIADEQLAWGLERLGMEHITLRMEWSNRFTRRMGDALVTSRAHATGRVRFSVPLWPRATPAERRQTVLHELAHVAADLRHGARCKHGLRWKAVMRELGLEPERCHSVNRDGLRRRRR